MLHERDRHENACINGYQGVLGVKPALAHLFKLITI